MASTDRVEADESSHGTKRGRIASQACERCRTRKMRCDEQKPRCGPCRAKKVDCVYIETLSARFGHMEDAVAHHSNVLAEMKNKFDTFISTSTLATQQGRGPPGVTSLLYPNRSVHQEFQLRPESAAHLAPSRPYLTVPHRVVMWPCMRILLSEAGMQAASDMTDISQEGTKWFIKRELTKHPRSLPSIIRPSASNSTNIFEVRDDESSLLTSEQTMKYTHAYFRTFNVLLPILDYDTFVDVTLERLSREGYVDGEQSVIVALLVFALGKLAKAGIFGEPVSAHDGVASGFRGGDLENPPGLCLFNEARRRHGFVDSLCALENVQIHALQAMYYEANARHLEFWKSITAASLTMQALLRSQHFEWSTQEGDMLSRAYWVCLLQEDLYHLDLDLPSTGIQKYEDEVPFPLFHSQPGPYMSDNKVPETRLHLQHHFLAMIALRRLIVRIHVTIHDSATTRAESSNQYGGIPTRLIHEMGRQLDSWRSLLPPPLQWRDDDRLKFPKNTLRETGLSFLSDESGHPVDNDYNIDILTAQLRTRYYYARYILYRPFLYKALHFPELMSPSEADCCALAIDSMCLWPALMAPPKAKKRLVPHLFAWTHNVLGCILIFKSIQRSECLKQICEEQVSRESVENTTTLILDWMRDAKQVDGTAEWAWTIIEWLFGVEGLSQDQKRQSKT